MENESPPSETVIRYSTLNLLGYLVLCGVMAVFSVHHLWPVRPLGVGAPILFLIGVGCIVVIGRQRWLLGHNCPQLTINERGVQLGEAPVDAWENIQGEEVRQVRRGRGPDTVLHYRAGNEVRELSLRELAISAAHLTRSLQHYRSQAQKLHHPTRLWQY